MPKTIKFSQDDFIWAEVVLGTQRAISCSNGKIYALRNQGNSKLENIHDCSKYNKGQSDLYEMAATSICNSNFAEEGTFDFKGCTIVWIQSPDGRL